MSNLRLISCGVVYGSISLLPIGLAAQTLDWCVASTYVDSELKGVETAPDGSVFVYGLYEPGGWLPDIRSYVAKYDAVGTLQWQYTLPWNVHDMSVSPQSEVILVGNFQGVIDCDPTSAVHTVLTDPAWTGLYVRLDGQAHVVRAFALHGSSLLRAEAIEDGGVFLMGTFTDTLDADPGPDAQYLVSMGERDIVIARYAENDSLLWAGSIAGAGADLASDLSWDGTELIASHKGGGIVDLDPGPDVSLIEPQHNGGLYISRMNGDGEFLGGTCIEISVYVDSPKVKRLAEGGFVLSAAINGGLQHPDPTDTTSNLQAQGMDGLLVKYDQSFAVEWLSHFAGGQSNGLWDIECTPNGQVIAAGWFMEDIDLDPGPGMDYHYCDGIAALFCAGYCLQTGGLDWSVVASGPTGVNIGGAVELVDEGHFLFAGSASEGTDMDPGPGVFEPNSDETEKGLLTAYSNPPAPCAWTISPTGIEPVGGQDLSGLSIVTDAASGALVISNMDLSRRKPLQFTVLNTMGQLLTAQSSLDDRSSIDISTFAPGVYVLRVGTPDGKTLRTFQFQRIQ